MKVAIDLQREIIILTASSTGCLDTNIEMNLSAAVRLMQSLEAMCDILIEMRDEKDDAGGE
jgi:hypothetical protein